MNFTFDVTLKNRAIFTHFLDTISLEDLNTIPKGFNNTIFWNIAHILVTQQLLVYKLSGITMLLEEEFVNTYKKGTKTENAATLEDVAFVKNLLISTIEKTQEDYNSGIFKTYTEYTVSTKSTLTNVEDALTFNNFHEGIHLGYILAQKRALGI